MNADITLSELGQINDIAWTMYREGVPPDQARFWARRARVSIERVLAKGCSEAGVAPEIATTLAKRREDEIFRLYTLFSRAGGAPWDFYPVREHGEKLGKTLRGVAEADLEAAMAPYLDPIKADLMRRGFPEEDAEGWCEEIAGESGMWMDDDPPAEWLALCGDEAPASP
ncbi:hypothetical protein FBZ82_12616 [Azospirillum brasilense]|uniref:Uncharacterized protein n=1 Tax=Azospirillum brasilense TaxID=192 RepID=A0A560AFX5_AZOBR|nr:hypothetical protein [Azospirillum brasilense]TWA59255.1 hypothetical protein FBZ82_12616 [Azospirillum brasilense]